MARQDGVHDLRHDRIVIANDAGKDRTVLAQPSHQVLAQLVLDSAGGEALLGKRTFAQFAESLGNTHEGNPRKENFLKRIIPLAALGLLSGAWKWWQALRRTFHLEIVLLPLCTYVIGLFRS